MIFPLARLALILGDAFAFLCALVISAFVARYFSETFAGNVYLDLAGDESTGRAISFSMLALLAMFLFLNRGHYTWRTPWWNQVRYIALVCLGLLCVDGFLYFAAKYSFSRLWIVFSWLHAVFFLLLFRLAVRYWTGWLGAWKIPTVIVGEEENSVETLLALKSEAFTGYDVRAILMPKAAQFDRASLPKLCEHVRVWDLDQRFSKIVRRYPNLFFVLAPDSLKHFPLEEYVAVLEQKKRGYTIVPPLEGVPLYGARPQYFFGHDVMFLWTRGKLETPLARVVKRAMDVVGASVALVLCAPVMVWIAWSVRRDGGPVLFRQKRAGRGRKSFACLKFRTMAVDAEDRLQELLRSNERARHEWERDHKLRDDPRVTRIGKFLRRSSLDELPQLFHVLTGEMSLVGPRPIAEHELPLYGAAMEIYYRVRPGITGLWQVSGRNDTGHKHRMRLDAWYVRNWSLWCDVVILLKTISVLIRKEGAY